jgi:diguanylate cyclase (GGDEF)-like protein/PAS domain S-box-containing protein
MVGLIHTSRSRAWTGMSSYPDPDDALPATQAAGQPQRPPPLADERLDCLTRLAHRYFGLRYALILLKNDTRIEIRSCNGLPFCDLGEQELSLFATAMASHTPQIVADTLADPLFAQLPKVQGAPHLRFCASQPILGAEGSVLGAVCLLDTAPQQLDADGLGFLADLARMAEIAFEREASEARLRDRERTMALAIAGSGTGIWDRNAVTGDIEYSPGWKALIGYDENELTSNINDSYTRVHPDDLTYVQAAIQDHFDGKTGSYSVEHRIRCKNGRYKWISSRGKVVSRDPQGQPLRMVGTTTDISELKRVQAELEELATVDSLTQLANRRSFMNKIEAERERLQRTPGKPSAVLMADLDHFKAVNDRWGHAVGDLVLKHFAELLRNELRTNDFAGRVGGEEFAVVLGSADIAAAQAFARRLQRRLAEAPAQADGQPIAVTLSVGVALMEADCPSVQDALRRADRALYLAKERGRDRIEIG